jgi:hypothetical protein
MVCLGMTVVLAAVWFSSAWWGCGWWSASRRWGIGIEPCRVVASYWRSKPTGPVFPPGGRAFYSQNEAGYPVSLFAQPYFSRSSAVLAVGVPIWIFVASAGAMLFYADRRTRRLAHRLAESICPKCGYDLTGLGDAGDSVTCPECGRPHPLLRGT